MLRMLMHENGCRDHAAAAGLRLKTHEPEKLLELILEEIRKSVNNVIVLDEYSR